MRPLACLVVLAFAAVALAGCSNAPPPGQDTQSQATFTVTHTQTRVEATSPPGTTSPPTSTTAAASSPFVALYDNRYDPTTLGVPAYTKVTFTNKGTVSHTVTIAKQGDPPGSHVLDQPLQPDTSNHQTFSNPGTYEVWCRYHGTQGGTSGMTMTVVVK